MNGEDLNDIFADYEAIRNDDQDAADNGNEETEADGTESSQAAAAAVRRRIVRNPRPKLNAERLCSERGIPALEKHFENVHFKEGTGHEKENLDILMANLEHWAHRLFPSLKFSESLTHIEKLGRKKPVQVCIKKLRLGMPILSQDFIHDAEDGIDDVQRESEMETNEAPESTFDQLMREHRESFPETAPIIEDNIMSPSSPIASHYDSPLTVQKPVAEEQILTEEQKQRIERNKMLAAERRKAKWNTSTMSSTSGLEQNNQSPPKDFSSDVIFDSEIVRVPDQNHLESSLTNNSDDEICIPNADSPIVTIN